MLTDEIDYVFIINKTSECKKIHGTIKQIRQSDSVSLPIKITLHSISSNITQVNIEFEESFLKKHQDLIISIGAASSLLFLFEAGLVNMQTAFGASAGSVIMGSIKPAFATVSKPQIFLPMILGTLITAGLVGDFTGPELFITYEIENPPQNYYNTALEFNFNPKDRSGIYDTDCNVDSGTNVGIGSFVLRCSATDNSIFRHTSVKEIKIDVEEPHRDWPPCLKNHVNMILDTQQSDPKPTNIHNMTYGEFKKKTSTLNEKSYSAYEDKNFKQSIQFANTVLDFYDPNDPTSLSLIAIAIRDHDRENRSAIECAKEIHETPIVQSTVTGKIALSEDEFLLENYNETISITTSIIDEYEKEKQLNPTYYVNSLIIRSNSELREASDNLELAEGFYDRAEIGYMLANAMIDTENKKDLRIIEQSNKKMSDLLLGLGNISFFRDNDASQAIDYYRDSLNHFPDNFDAKYWLIKTLIHQNKIDEAKQEFAKLTDDEEQEFAKLTDDEENTIENFLKI